MNRNYGKLDAENKIGYAPDAVTIDDVTYANPTAEHYKDAGYYPIVSEKPEKLGVYYTPTERGTFDAEREVIVREWEEHAIVAPPTVYIVEEIIYQLIEAEKLQATKAVVGDYWELLTMRDRIEADNEMWGVVFPQVCAGLIAAGVFANQDEIDAMLAKCRDGYVDEESGREVR